MGALIYSRLLLGPQTSIYEETRKMTVEQTEYEGLEKMEGTVQSRIERSIYTANYSRCVHAYRCGGRGLWRIYKLGRHAKGYRWIDPNEVNMELDGSSGVHFGQRGTRIMIDIRWKPWKENSRRRSAFPSAPCRQSSCGTCLKWLCIVQSPNDERVPTIESHSRQDGIENRKRLDTLSWNSFVVALSRQNPVEIFRYERSCDVP